jgi:hypothetical protein
MNRFSIEEVEGNKRKDKVYNSEDDAKKAAYCDEVGMYLPSSHVEASLKKAASEFKKGRKTYKEAVLSGVFVDEEKLYLGKKTWDEIDRRPVVIQRNRIVKSRPKFNSWEVSFTITFNDQIVPADILKDILIEAGATKGVGDYRPKFGRFSVSNFEVVKND